MATLTVEPLAHTPGAALVSYSDGVRGIGPCLWPIAWMFSFHSVAHVCLYGPWHIPEKSE